MHCLHALQTECPLLAKAVLGTANAVVQAITCTYVDMQYEQLALFSMMQPTHVIVMLCVVACTVLQ
jgi:hypothetical protein